MRRQKIIRVGSKLFIITLIAAWIIFIIGAKIKSPKPEQNPIDPYVKKVARDTDKGNRGYVEKTTDYIDNGNQEIDTRDVNTENIDDWEILLVNADNPIPKGYSVELSNIDSIRKFDSRAIDDLINLMEDCRTKTGSSIWAQSTYRERSTQKKLFNDEIKQYIDEGKSRAEAERLANFSVAAPGTSEHETGLAVDFNHVNMEFENSPAFEWLIENSYKYGFILRYPKDKQSITRMAYEPWHFRYVGKHHAKMMKSNNFCLEEYIDYLKNQREN